MKILTINFRNIIFLLLMIIFPACEDNWLEEKRDIKLVVPSTLQDMRALLNNSFVFSKDNRGLADPLADDYYVDPSTLDRFGEPNISIYKWQIDPLYGGLAFLPDWDNSYHQIFISNVVLEGLAGIDPLPSEQEEWNDIKGNALLYRGRAFFNLAQLFCTPYEEGKADATPGIPVREVSDVKVAVSRSSVKYTYERIIDDFKAAAGLLREESSFKLDGTKAAAYGMLARTYLVMGKYDEALLYADSCLQKYDHLLDYNTLDPTDRYPFPIFNDEVIFHGSLSPNYILTTVHFGLVDTLLIDSYENNDLRKQLFFKEGRTGGWNFRGAYTGAGSRFSGIATDEVFLIRAECYARAGKTGEAMADLNRLLETRFETGTFEAYSAANAEEALQVILEERRKELLFRGLRWSDLRRLNDNTVSRKIGNDVFTLEPNSNGYIMPIPQYVIDNTGIDQNSGY